MKTISLINKNLGLYRTSYNWKHSKEDITKRVIQNYMLAGMADGNTSEIILECPEFNHIKKTILKTFSTIYEVNYPINTLYGFRMWSYKSDANLSFSFNDNMWHDHREFSPLLKITPKATFCFYVNVPKDVKKDEGKLYFNDNGELYKFTPETGDIIFFLPTASHSPQGVTSTSETRIALCGNICYGFNDKDLTIRRSI